MSQTHQRPDESLGRPAQQTVKSERAEELKDSVERIRERAPPKTKQALDLVGEMGFNPNEREFRDAIRLRYDWPGDDIPAIGVCGEIFTVDHAMICKRDGFVIQRHNKLRDLEAEVLNTVFSDVKVEPLFQDISVEPLSIGANLAQDAMLDIYA